MKKTYFDVWGKYFGFPKCCVRAFVKHEMNSDIGYSSFVGIRKLHLTGFVPCTKCNNNKTESELLTEIEKNRICDVPFPETNNFIEEIDSIIKSDFFTTLEKSLIYYEYQEEYNEYLYMKNNANMYQEAC